MFLPTAQRSQLAGSRTAGIIPATRVQAKNAETVSMKKLIVFDLDGTLAESKASLDAEMAALINKLLGFIKVAVISGGSWLQFQTQVLSHLAGDERLKNLSLLPTCGTQFYKYEKGWEKIYSEDFTGEQKEKIISSLKKAIEQSGLESRKGLGRGDRRPGKSDHLFRIRPRGSLERKGKMGS